MARAQAKKTDNSNVIELQSDIEALQTDIGRIGKRLNIIAGKSVMKSRDTLATTAETAMEGLNAGMENGRIKANEVANQGRTAVQKRPLASCAAALGAGIVIGTMMRRRAKSTAKTKA
ncbi:MAG TPA: hypothetical protein DFI00_06105 [Rhodospirillaceae bacterium]|nr:hypothetical protein [Alphaproteobacteria bacterium]OUT39434.1 MAG: hypothetical protein CBB62_13735 [Micavibrio sp. TMED2]HCI46847.1 hypothetical protein [Rhodospirillaceae bacterium]MAS48813.1 hypothetical protein [Alphaproteobacteria bacterium]MAX94322.1 hypothetical protein [Alphaproteobacteria bacterium]|tara:strand:+ start:23252 stop:23605 length:354 start_codon:yes stop_codon:yes gene_type:complete